MPKKDFTQVAFAVVQQATGEAPKRKEKAPKKALENKKAATVRLVPKKSTRGC